MSQAEDVVVVRVRVKPGSTRPGVGGRHPTPGEPARAVFADDALIVRVAQRAVDGQANRAVLRAVAAAFGLSRSAVLLRSGATSRTKTLALVGDPIVIRVRLAALLRYDEGATPSERPPRRTGRTGRPG